MKKRWGMGIGSDSRDKILDREVRFHWKVVFE
jgi:hypothetical protein